MATLGPASRDPAMLRALLEAGVEIVRLNLSHGSHDEHRETVGRVRSVSAALDRHVPVLVDLMGPRYRLGPIPGEGQTLRQGELLVLAAEGGGGDLPFGQPEIIGHLDTGERVLIDGGRVELRVEERRADRAVARVVRGGVVTSRKGINLPETKVPFEITGRDRADVAFAVDVGADLVGASYVAGPDDLERLRAAVAAAGGSLPLVAKIERAAAIERVEGIVIAADAVMVARGDLGVEVPFEDVPVIQKRIIDAGRATGTPVIVATDMLGSMIERPRPTRAEVSDVANAVFEGADVLMLSGETAIGRYPIESVSAMERTIRSAEGYEQGARRGLSRSPASTDATEPDSTLPDAVAAAAARAAELLGVHMIVAFSQSGSTARLLARYRPAMPILAFTSDERIARVMQLLWGIQPAVIPPPEQHEEAVEIIDRELLRRGLARRGDVIVVLMGAPIQERPRTNLMRVHRVGGGTDDVLGTDGALRRR